MGRKTGNRPGRPAGVRLPSRSHVRLTAEQRQALDVLAARMECTAAAAIRRALGAAAAAHGVSWPPDPPRADELRTS